MDTVPFTRSVEPVVRLGKPWSAAGGAVRAALKTLANWARRGAPAAVGPITRAQEAHETREYAVKFLSSDPRFAAELRAAADRHELAGSA